jgi:hypothetical protein
LLERGLRGGSGSKVLGWVGPPTVLYPVVNLAGQMLA